MTIQELEQCILLYGKDIYSFCMHLAKEKESADDLYQDAFLEATKKIASIVKKAKETQNMKHRTLKSGVAAAAAIGILVVGSASAYAAYRYLTPSQVADQMTEDGTPMPGQMDDSYQTFCVSVLIHGKSFMDVNNGTLGAGAQALFMLPLDKAKADDKAAEKYFTQIEEQKDDENAAAQNETDEMAGKEQIEKRLDGAKLIESETKTVTPDEDGMISISTPDEKLSYSVSDWIYDVGEESIIGESGDGTEEGTRIETLTKNEDGTFTYQVYRPAKAQLK